MLCPEKVCLPDSALESVAAAAVPFGAHKIEHDQVVIESGRKKPGGVTRMPHRAGSLRA